MKIFKLSPKAIRKNAFKDEFPNDLRLIFRSGSSSAILYYKSSGEIQEHSLYYKNPDSHVELTGECVPTNLKCSKRIFSEISELKVNMLGLMVSTY